MEHARGVGADNLRIDRKLVKPPSVRFHPGNALTTRMGNTGHRHQESGMLNKQQLPELPGPTPAPAFKCLWALLKSQLTLLLCSPLPTETLQYARSEPSAGFLSRGAH